MNERDHELLELRAILWVLKKQVRVLKANTWATVLGSLTGIVALVVALVALLR